MAKNKQKIHYNQRAWLNPNSSHSTGSIVACHGHLKFGDKVYKNEMFLEVSSCSSMARIHKAGNETKEDFIKKITVMQKAIKNFKKHLGNS